MAEKNIEALASRLGDDAQGGLVELLRKHC